MQTFTPRTGDDPSHQGNDRYKEAIGRHVIATGINDVGRMSADERQHVSRFPAPFATVVQENRSEQRERQQEGCNTGKRMYVMEPGSQPKQIKTSHLGMERVGQQFPVIGITPAEIGGVEDRKPDHE